MALDAAGRRHRARLAALHRHHPDQPDIGADERRELRAGQAERYVRELVASWPPLTESQRARLAILLLGGGDGAQGSTP